MKTEKIDFNSVVVEDLEGNRIYIPGQFPKDLGNLLYTTAPSIEIADLGRKVYESFKNQVDLLLSEQELIQLVEVIDNARLLGHPAHIATKQYLTNKLTSFKN